jgi:uncharacterized protein YndB with AHSA1/START domain
MESVNIASSPRLQVRRTFRAPPEQIFAAWTSPEALKSWHAPGPLTCVLAEVDLRVGGTYRIHMQEPDGTLHRVGGVYRTIDPPRKLVFTWKWESKEEGETVVTIECVPAGTGTELILTHEGFETDAMRASHEGGWTSIVSKIPDAV